jgi:ATP-dependent Clp protease ATP-binding subunit ClpB
VADIAEMMLKNLSQRLSKQINISLSWDQDVLGLLAKEGYDPAFGARPLRRVISRVVETELSKKIVQGKVPEGSTVELKIENGKIAVG